MTNRVNGISSDPSPNRAPSVTCVIATHNRSHLVADAVSSVLADGYEKLDAVVVVDGSTDGTVDVLRERFGDDPRVQVVEHAEPLGVAHARNSGIDVAGGDYITFLDDDDLNLPGRIAGQVKLAVEHDVDFVTCTRFYYETAHSMHARGAVRDRIELNDMWLHNPIVNVTPLVQADLMRKVRFDPTVLASEDFDAWVRCLQQCSATVNYSELCIRHRRIETFTLTKNRKQKFASRRKLFQRYKAVMPLRWRIWYRSVTLAKYFVPDPLFTAASLMDLVRGRRTGNGNG